MNLVRLAIAVGTKKVMMNFTMMPGQKSYPLLLVEDDENDVLFFERAVRKCNAPFNVAVVRDGQSAIEYFAGEREYADRAKYPFPCLTFLDLNLPHKNGLEVLRSLRGQPGVDRPVVIVLTSSASERDIREAYNLGANSYLTKPSNAEQLVDLVHDIQSYWLRWNQLPTLCQEV